MDFHPYGKFRFEEPINFPMSSALQHELKAEIFPNVLIS